MRRFWGIFEPRQIWAAFWANSKTARADETPTRSLQAFAATRGENFSAEADEGGAEHNG